MGYESLTDEKITKLLLMPKKITNPHARDKLKGKHVQRDYSVIATDEPFNFNLYLRQNLELIEDFSCGLSWNMPSGEIITLIRYNGSSHPHPNVIEKEHISFKCHIHRASEKYILARKKPCGYAEISNNYYTLSGALHCIVTDCFITGIETTPDLMDIFYEPQPSRIER